MSSFRLNALPDATPFDHEAHEAVHAGMPQALAELARLVRIPSVSWAAFDADNVVQSAQAVAELARSIGFFDSVDVTRSRLADSTDLGQPAVLALRQAKKGAPTVLLYAHHDVQPPGSSDDWRTPPFEPTVIGDRLYGRGAADDKAGIMVHLAAIRALTRVVGDDLDIGVVLFIEGEEEFGSRSFDNFLSDNRESLEADAIVVADSNNWNEETPALTVGLRGNVTFRLTVRTLEHASHSGMFGGAVPDSMLATIKLLATLWHDNGSVAVHDLTTHTLSAPEFSAEQLASEAALLPGVSPIGEGDILSRMWSQPSITVTGIDAPSVANASNTLSPRTSVKVSVRVAPGQKASDAFAAVTAHLRSHAPFGAVIDIDDVDLGDPFLVDSSGPAVRAVKKAMHDAWGREPTEIGVGGSIPFIPSLVRAFPSAEILVTGVEDPDSRAHSPNESLHLGVFHRAILTEALFLLRMSAGQQQRTEA